MSIQEISISNNQAKNLLKALPDENVLIQDENGDIVVNVSAYTAFKVDKNASPVELIIGEDNLDAAAEYWIFS